MFTSTKRLFAALGLAFVSSSAFAEEPGAQAIDRLVSCTSPETAAPPPAPPGPAFGGPLLERPYLGGDWFGTRSAMADHGITWDISNTNFYQGVTSGGLNHDFQYGGRADYLAHIDGEKAGLWKGFMIDLHGETIYGKSANSATGALASISTGQLFPVPSPTTALTGVKFTQALSESFMVYAGKLNMVDPFNQPFTGGGRGINGFMNCAMILPVSALRTVPYSTYGAGFAVLQGLEPVLSVTVVDNANTPTTTGFENFFNNGVSVIAIGSLPVKLFGLPGHQSLGGSYSNGKFTPVDALPFFVVQSVLSQAAVTPAKEAGAWSVFYMFDQAIWVDPTNPQRSWGVFGNLGLADGDPSPIRWNANIGVGGSSPIACRKLDTFGVGYYYIGIGDSLRRAAPNRLGDEHGVEVFYNFGLTPWFHITPDLQIVTPTRSLVDSSLAFGLRAKIDF